MKSNSDIECKNDGEIESICSFNEWQTLNDTIMGGESQSNCFPIAEGLLLRGVLTQKNGGFVSCRSSLFSPPLNLSKYKGIKLSIDGEGHRMKFALKIKSSSLGLNNLFNKSISWITTFPTNKRGTSIILIPFSELIPSIRAKKVMFPAKFDPSSITRFQLLYSKFDLPGKINNEFKDGDFQILLRSINAYS